MPDLKAFTDFDSAFYRLTHQIARDHAALSQKVDALNARLSKLEATMERLDAVLEKVEMQAALSKQKLSLYERAGWMAFSGLAALAAKFLPF